MPDEVLEGTQKKKKKPPLDRVTFATNDAFIGQERCRCLTVNGYVGAGTEPVETQKYLLGKFLGEGSLGAVYLVHPIDPTTKKPDRKKALVVKFYSGKNAASKDPASTEEGRTNRLVYGRGVDATREPRSVASSGNEQSPVNSAQKVVLMPYFQGQELFSIFKNRSFLIRLSLLEKLQLINEILHAVQVISTRGDLVHRDLKPENIIVTCSRSRNKARIFGAAVIDLEFATQGGQNSFIVGTPGSIPIEFYNKDHPLGSRTDVYALTAIIAWILDANPYTEKDGLYNPLDKTTFTTAASAPYNLGDLFSLTKKVSFPHPIKIWVEQFLRRMSDNEFYHRPEIPEVMRFFTTLNNYVLTFEQNHSDYRSLTVYAAQLTLMASGLWSNSFWGFEYYDFTKHLDLAAAIAYRGRTSSAETTELNKDTVDEIMRSTDPSSSLPQEDKSALEREKAKEKARLAREAEEKARRLAEQSARLAREKAREKAKAMAEQSARLAKEKAKAMAEQSTRLAREKAKAMAEQSARLAKEKARCLAEQRQVLIEQLYTQNWRILVKLEKTKRWHWWPKYTIQQKCEAVDFLTQALEKKDFFEQNFSRYKQHRKVLLSRGLKKFTKVFIRELDQQLKDILQAKAQREALRKRNMFSSCRAGKALVPGETTSPPAITQPPPQLRAQ